MKKQVSVERIYNLGDYSHIKFYTTTELDQDISPEFMSEIVNSLTLLQLIDTELAFRKYLMLLNTVPLTSSPKDAVDLLEDIREESLAQVAAILKGE